MVKMIIFKGFGHKNPIIGAISAIAAELKLLVAAIADQLPKRYRLLGQIIFI